MTPGHTINIVPTAAHVEVRLGGRLLATTDRAMKLDETGLPSRYYLPPDDVQMDLLSAIFESPHPRSLKFPTLSR
jgi:uncharacterized protein (DUF427 family)